MHLDLKCSKVLNGQALVSSEYLLLAANNTSTLFIYKHLFSLIHTRLILGKKIKIEYTLVFYKLILVELKHFFMVLRGKNKNEYNLERINSCKKVKK